jgi:hypothetical protein
MALQQTINLDGQSIVKTAFGDIENGTQRISAAFYIKVVSVNGDKKQAIAHVSFKNGNNQFGKQFPFSVSVEPGAQNFIEQAYSHLKTLPEFAGATDC